jgi:2-succinyl-5-enolpyruvyl-6-hydroxy-3-cyclohexene-1-carboxylate synthase
MKATNLNHLWGKLIFAELARLGVEQVCLSPGSRSTPLAIAAAESENHTVTIHFDERGAAFAALGYAKATGHAAALICTSGTALVNYYPAIVEANLSQTPLLILSADRPEELRDCGAPQTIDQVDIFGRYLRCILDLPAPTEEIAPDWLLERVDQTVAATSGSYAGPVQLNCQFREPLAPLGELQSWDEYLQPVRRWLTTDQPFTSPKQPGVTVLPSAKIVAQIGRVQRGVILAGPLPAHARHDKIVELANKLGWPLLADISSGIRFANESECVLSHADLYLRDQQIAKVLRPDLVLHFGGVPSSKAVLSFLAELSADYIQVSEHEHPQDPLHVVTERVQANPNDFAEQLLLVEPQSNSDWSVVWQQADNVAGETVTGAFETELSELAVAQLLPTLLAPSSGLWLANSMPIRDVDALAHRRSASIVVGSNRGANGIDGTVASAVGFAGGLGQPITLLLGDLALLHDLNSLALVRDSEQPVIVIVLNNNGGGIFHFLPLAEVDQHFEKYFGTPHGCTFEKAAGMFGLEYCQPNNIPSFKQEYLELANAGRSVVIEITSSRERNLEQHKSLWLKVATAVADALQLS